MGQLVEWLNYKSDLPVPVKAAIAHYQYATVHPYYDGNGRTARLLATLVYYMGRAEADITSWVEYFIVGMREASAVHDP